MYDKVMIWNMALSRLKSSEQVSSDTDVTPTANWCRLWYDHCLDTVLRDFDWPFASRRVALADVGSPSTNWEYAYAYPSDCVKVRALVVEGDRNPKPPDRYQYEIANNGSMRIIQTDTEIAELLYTARITDTTLFDPHFVSALVANLACELAMPVTGKAEYADRARQYYMVALDQAIARAMNEVEQGPEPASTFETYR